MKRRRARPGPSRRRKDSEDHILPLINIVFLLLSFFLIAGQITKTNPIEISPPNSVSERPDRPNDATVQIDADGTLTINGVEAHEPDLAMLFAEREADVPLRVHADGAVNAGLVLQLFQDLRRIGWNRVILVTTRPPA